MKVVSICKCCGDRKPYMEGDAYEIFCVMQCAVLKGAAGYAPHLDFEVDGVRENVWSTLWKLTKQANGAGFCVTYPGFLFNPNEYQTAGSY